MALKIKSKLAIESWEDRSGSNAFGYVYFSDDSRVGFTVGLDDTPDVWPARTNGGGRSVPVTDLHLSMAATFLRDQGINIRDNFL